jgi:hypothetical protein
MSKRIIITESQYGRLFLDEQKLPKSDTIGAIQQFLKDKGVYKNKVDSDFGDETAKAFAQYYYNINTNIDTVNKLWKKLKSEGRDVGNKSGFGPKMFKEVSGMINFKEKPSSVLTNLYNGLVDNIKPYINKGLEYVTKGSKWLGDKVSQELYDKHIKNQKDGDKFREWVYQDKKRVDFINNELKKLGFKDGFSKSGAYGNDYFKVAWGLYGVKYIGTTVREYISDDDWYDKIFDEEIKNSTDELKDSISKYKSTYRNSGLMRDEPYQNYKKAISNWNNVHTEFEWVGDKSFALDASNFNKLEKVSDSTCINPSYLMIKQFIVGEKLRIARMGRIGVWGSDQTKDSEGDHHGYDIWKELFNFKTLGELDEYIRGKIKEVGEDHEQKYESFDPNDPDSRPWEVGWNKAHQYLTDLLDDEDLKETFVLNNNYSELLQTINKHNLLIKHQSKDFLENTKWISKSFNPDKKDNFNLKSESKLSEQLVTPLAGAVVPLDDNSEFNYKMGVWSMVEACTTANAGGAFIRFDPMTPNTPKKFLCCVTPQEDMVKDIGVFIYSGGNHKRIGRDTINFEQSCKYRDGRTSAEWWSDKSEDCWKDWHCLADVLSIVVSFFGPYGIILGSIIDIGNAASYAIEQDEGWKWDMGLTLLGILPGAIEVSKLIKGSPEAFKVIQEIGKLPKGMDPIRAQVEIHKLTKSLSTADKKQFDTIRDILVKSENGTVIPPWNIADFKILEEELKTLTKWEMDELSKLFKGKSQKEINNLYKSSGESLKSMLKKQKISNVVSLSSGVQLGLFGGIYFGSDKIADALERIHKDTGWDPFGVFDESGNEKTSGGESVLDWDLINKDIGVKQKIKTDLKLDLSGLGETGDQMTYQLNKTYEIMKSYRTKIDVLQSSFDDSSDIYNLLNKLKFYPMSNRKSGGLSNLFDNTNQDILNFVEGLDISKDKTKLREEIESFNKKIYAIPIEEKTQDQLQIQIISNEDETKEQAEEKMKRLREILDNAILKDENMELNEEINRIKTLFTNERLYGNLVNEACEDVDDAIKFLNDKGYRVKTTTEHDLCIGPRTPLGKIYDSLEKGYDDFKKLKLNVKNYGDQCGLTLKHPLGKSGQFYIITLFSDMDDVKSGQFNMFYKMDEEIPTKDICPDLTALSGIRIVASGDRKVDLPNGLAHLGLKYIKVDGVWGYDDTTKKVTLKDAIITGLFDKDVKGIKTSFNTPMGNVDLNDLGLLPTGGSIEMFTKNGTDCLNTGDFVSQTLDWDLASEKEISILLDKII